MTRRRREYRDEFGDLPQHLVVPDPGDWPDAGRYTGTDGWHSTQFWQAREDWRSEHPDRVLPLAVDRPVPDEPFPNPL